LVLSDEKIKKDIIDQLYWDSRVDASNVKVDVENYAVTLSGSVSNYLARKAATEAAWNIKGVQSVENRLSIKFPRDINVPIDMEIKDSINNALYWDPYIDSRNIKISVEKGWVKLEGSVDIYWKLEYVEDIISGIFGVIKITNNLTTVPTGNIIDQALANDLMSALDRKDGVDTSNINIKVKDGVVTLSGFVPNRVMERLIYQTAIFMKGVIFVKNHIKIEPEVYAAKT